MPETKHRLQLDFSEGAWEETNNLLSRTGLPDRGELIRHALRWFQWTFDEVEKGITVLHEKDGKTLEVAFPFWNVPCDSQGQGEGSGDGSGGSPPGQPDITK